MEIMDWEDKYIPKEDRNKLAEEMEEDLDSSWDKELAEMNEEIVRAILRERKVDEKKIGELLEDGDFRSSVFLYSIVCPFVKIHIEGEGVDRMEDAIEEYLTGN